ncbi:DsbC family protein, partial [Klebsiella pneumoniae]|nr:DsbC family protein [Klebsiella pneumoniae]
KYASIIPMKELNLNIADLQPAVWGSGPEKVMIFIDPNCQYCHATLKELADLDPKKYTVNVISLGALGEDSKKRNQELYCASDRYRADRAIISGDNKTKFDQVKNCDQSAMIRRNITAQVLGVSMVPFIIRDDGNYSIGKPAQGLKAYLEAK